MKNIVLIIVLGMALLSSSHDVSAAGEISQAKAMQLAKRKVDGRILKVDENREVYKVKLLKPNGRVVTLRVDKRTGRVTGAVDKKD